RAKNHDIPNAVISRKQFAEDEATVMAAVKDCDFIILAGFLVKVPNYLIDAYPKRIINIHPALLPKYGGKGMYGHHIHEAVKAAGEKETGITIHFVNNELDAGEHIAQFKVALSDEDTADTIAAKIHELEQAHFPKVIESVIKA
ncbi:MAG: phosphoribosylglycinamide formyltransferase, partial [Bacteroidaceae bacterium]|nr:phosphoribosylglycinamide formyltransferase [Bacteroidaceae bacterium]